MGAGFHRPPSSPEDGSGGQPDDPEREKSHCDPREPSRAFRIPLLSRPSGEMAQPEEQKEKGKRHERDEPPVHLRMWPLFSSGTAEDETDGSLDLHALRSTSEERRGMRTRRGQ